MSILQDIVEWSGDLPDWLSDAARRAFEKEKLEPSDFDDFAAMLMASRGVPDEAGRVPVRLAKDMVPARMEPGEKVSLLKLGSLANINAIDSSQSLDFAPEGITIVYGSNGAGKSGYARVLKRACRARDQSERILPNVFSRTGKEPPPQAEFEWEMRGDHLYAPWKDGSSSPDPLSAIAVFDSKCARAYIDQENDVAFIPYGLDILTELARACDEVKARINAKLAEHPYNAEAFRDFDKSTKVGTMLTALSAETDPDRVKALAEMSEESVQRMAFLRKSLHEENPVAKAASLRRSKGRVEKFAETIKMSLGTLGAAAANDAKGQLADLQEADKAAKVAAEGLTASEDVLKGTGGVVWKDLLLAAMRYSDEQAYPGLGFPAETDESRCVLCQQPLLEDGAMRLARFADYIGQEAEKSLAKCKAAVAASLSRFEKANPEALQADAMLFEEMREIDAPLAESALAFAKALSDRKAKLIENMKGVLWAEPTALPEPILDKLAELAKRLEEMASELDKAATADARRALETEIRELESRHKLSERLQEALGSIETLKTRARLNECLGQTDTRKITNKGSELREKSVSTELRDALNRELEALDVHQLRVSLDTRGAKGVAKQKLKLDIPVPKAGETLSDILSEGEQRSIAVASFLAEASLTGNKSGLVFDDPVSSLDHIRREKIADRIAKEAKDRQVVVFTHDLFFAKSLMVSAEKAAVPCCSKTLRFASGKAGVVLDGLPFEGQKVPARLDALRKLAHKAKAEFENGDIESSDNLIRLGYGRLRDTWERLVEEDLFSGTVMRFRRSVETLRLKKVDFGDDEFVAVEEGMSRCSRFAHDTPVEAQDPVPTHEEFLADIEKLDGIAKSVKAKAKVTEERRALVL